jgi:hypothetical protein
MVRRPSCSNSVTDRIEDHIKNLYKKLGVASRQELVARVFLDEYRPGSCSRHRSHRAGASTADSGPGAAVGVRLGTTR